ncbi:NRDE family protein [Legionella sp. CNM-4043-24]|uniref:NRDE family protein n=1 Tax=Legionella sp. CNM-4043-24 TaxID=3421646 RepID=UPI00403AC2E0
MSCLLKITAEPAVVETKLIVESAMCLVLIAVNQHPRFPLVILSNRDEFYSRASLEADFWKESPNLYAGIDLVKQGTWLGLTRQGRVSLVTNYRNPSAHQSFKRSRGLLVARYLQADSTTTAGRYIEELKGEADQYNKFNLIAGDESGLYYYSNVEYETKKLQPGVYGLSNSLLDTPWYKVTRVKRLFHQMKNDFLACDTPEAVSELLLPVLSDTHKAPDRLLPETGVGKELEKLLSSIFVEIPEHGYGTRSSSVLVFGREQLMFSEKTYEQGLFNSLKTSLIPIDRP